MLFQAVEVEREGQVLAVLEEGDLLLQQQRVGAEVDEALALHQLGDDLRHLLVDQRLAAGDRDDRRAALLHRLDAFGNRPAKAQDLVWVVDLASDWGGEVAAEQPLENEHPRKEAVPADTRLHAIDHPAERLAVGDTPEASPV